MSSPQTLYFLYENDVLRGDNMDDNKLLRIFNDAGATYGYRYVDASFKRTRNLRVDWRVNGVRLEVDVPDYLDILPDVLMVELADRVCDHIRNKTPLKHTQELRDFLHSDRFLSTKQPIFVERDGHLLYEPAYQGVDINRMYTRLIQLDLLDPYQARPMIMWSTNPVAPWGVDAWFDLIRLPTWLSHPDIPDELRTYMLYEEIIHLDFEDQSDPEATAAVELYPNHKVLSGFSKLLRTSVREATMNRGTVSHVIKTICKDFVL